MSARYDRDGERIDRPSWAEAQADAIALGDLEPRATWEEVAAYTAAMEAHLARRHFCVTDNGVESCDAKHERAWSA